MSDAARHAEIAHLAARAEAAVERMYGTGGAGAYSEAKDLYCDAIALAKSLGDAARASELEARLADVKESFRRMGL